MNKNKKRQFWIILIGVSFIVLIYIIVKFCNGWSCIKNDNQSNITPENLVKDQETEIKAPEVIDPVVQASKIDFNKTCNQITSKEGLLDFIQNEEIILTEELKLLIKDYVENKINKSELENKLLEVIWNTDDKDAWRTRLQLNFLFLKINDLERWNTTNCDEIFDQYNK